MIFISISHLFSLILTSQSCYHLLFDAGTPVDLDRLDGIREDFSKVHGFKPVVIQDCAHAFGAESENKTTKKYSKVSKLRNGHMCCFSTQAIKHLTTGDGGILTLFDQSLYERGKLLRWYGIDRDKRNYKRKDLRLESDIVEYGYKFHMNDLNATIGLANLPHMSEILAKCRDNARFYNQELCDLSAKGLEIIHNTQGSSFWLYTIRLIGLGKKQAFMDFMKSDNITVTQVHKRNDINTCVKQFQEELPNMDKLEKEMICIPVGWWLTKECLERVVRSIKSFLAVSE